LRIYTKQDYNKRATFLTKYKAAHHCFNTDGLWIWRPFITCI